LTRLLEVVHGAGRRSDIGLEVDALRTDYRTKDLTEDVTFEDLLKELDAILAPWFFEEIRPALDEARDALDALAAA
jgi:hypothetical protein